MKTTLQVVSDQVGYIRDYKATNVFVIYVYAGLTTYNLRTRIKGESAANALVAKIKAKGVINLAHWDGFEEPADYFNEDREYELMMHYKSVRMHGEFGSLGND